MTVQTKADYVATIRKHTQKWMNREALGITPSDMRELFIEISTHVQAAHQIKIKMILTKIFKYGIESNLVKGMAILPTAGIKFQKEEEKLPEILTISEIRKLLYAAKEIRAFCEGIGIPSIRFHALRACFATQLIRQGIPAIQIQKICGWKDLETMQRYIRLAGIEISGVTENLKILPDNIVMGEVVNLFAPANQK
jgi:site-specific recombinase XerD